MNNEIQNHQQKPAQGASSKAGQGVSRQIMTVGTRVYSGLYGGRHGVVFAIHGNQVPESVEIMLDGVGVRGGNAHFDVVFEDGSMAIKLSEAIMRGIQWTIYNEQASIDEAFLDLNGTALLHGGSPAQTCIRLVRRIERDPSAPMFAWKA